MLFAFVINQHCGEKRLFEKTIRFKQANRSIFETDEKKSFAKKNSQKTAKILCLPIAENFM